MPETLILFIKYYFFFVSSFIFFYVLGHFCLKIISGFISIEGFYTNLFIKSLTGLSVSVITYSFAVTGFKTVNTGFILIAVFLIWELHVFKRNYKRKICLSSYPGNSFDSGEGNLWKKIYPLIFSSFVIYTWFSTVIFNQGHFAYSIPESDNIFYSDISKMLNITGQENIYGMSNQMSEQYHGLIPYHYFDLWLNAAFSVVFNSIHLVSLFLFTYPILNFITLLGFYSFIEKVTKVSYLHQAVVLFFLFMSGLSFYNENPSADYALNMAESPMESYGEKFSMYYPLIVCSFLFFIDGYLTIALLSLLILPILSITTAPGIFGGLFLFSFLTVIFKRMDKRYFFRMILYILSISVFIFLLYDTLGNKTVKDISTTELLSYTDISDQINRSLKIFFVELLLRIKNSALHLLLLHAPFILLTTWLIFKKNFRSRYGDLILAVSCVCFISLLIYQAVYKMSNSWQLYTNNLTLLNVVLVLVLIIILFKTSGTVILNSSLRKTIFIFFIVLLIAKGFNAFYTYNEHKKTNNNLFSEEFLTEIQNSNLNSIEKLPGASLIKGKRYYEVESALSANTTPYLSLMPQYLPCVYLNTFENFSPRNTTHIIKTGNSTAKNYVFYQFVETQKKENVFVNHEQSQSDFIDKYGIKYLIASESYILSNKISARVDKIITDSKSNQKFILLK